MRGVYTAQIPIASISGAKTLLVLRAPSNAVAEVLSASISNNNNDTPEQLEAGLFKITNIASIAGTAVTPTKHEPLDGASVCGSSGNLSAEPSSYDSDAIDRQGWNNLAGYRYDPIPEERPIVGPTGAIGLRILGTIDTAFSGVAQIVYREIG